jgi:hypothetical protein
VRGRVEPGERALRLLAATINPAIAGSSGVEIRYRLGFNENRRRGRPRRAGGAASSPACVADSPAASAVMAIARASSPAAPEPAAAATPEPAKNIDLSVVEAFTAEKKAVLFLCAGTLTLAKGGNPGPRFWDCLIGALNAEAQWWTQSRFPLKAKLVRIDARKGREKEPELETTRRVVAWFVQAHVDRGDGYDAAITLTHEELINTGKAEGWPGRIGRKSVKDAYDAHARAKRKK